MKAKGIIIALHTPLTPKGEIHEEALRAHLEYMVASGVHGIFPCGTMGEGINLSEDERGRVVAITVDQVRKRVPILAQITSNNTDACRRLAMQARDAGADAISAIAPFFYPSDGQQLEEFFTAIAQAVPGFPVYLYNNPGRSASGISSSLAAKLHKKVPSIVGIKDSSKDLILFQEYVELGGESFTCVIGTDGLVFPAMMVGGTGVVSGVANAFPELMVHLYESLLAKRYDRARKLQFLVNKLRVVLKIGPYLAGYKEILRLRGRDFPTTMKSPLRELNADEKAKIKAAFDTLPPEVFNPALVK